MIYLRLNILYKSFMKKNKVLAILFFIIILFGTSYAYLVYRSKPIKMYYRGEVLNIVNNPFRWEDNLYLPAKSVFNGINKTSFTKFNKDENVLYTNIDGKRIVIDANNSSMSVDNNNFEFEVPPVIENEVMYLPKMYYEKLDIYPEYNILLRKVNIKRKSSIPENEVLDNSKYEFNEDENLIYYKKENGEWERFLHDENDNIIFSINNESKTVQYQHNSDYNIISSQDSYNNYNEYIYNDDKKLIYSECSDGGWEKYTYDDNLNLINYENSKGELINYTYDDEGYLIKKESNDGKTENYKVLIK